MRSRKPIEIVGIVIFGIVAITGFAALFGFAIMWLWNALLPDIFGLTQISYWQAVGILILAKLLFGGFGSGGGSKSSKRKDKSDWGKGKNEFSKWGLYDKFWKEEGEAAYQDFIKRSDEPENEE
jgi:hypothetical protein